ncbi:MAG: hypothetical protein HOP28_11805, partial [Gemmatimonadales bacterium]|nr:hypothetical protein [Gemmatimonadales bacterium]
MTDERDVHVADEALAYLEGDLPGPRREVVERHLATCAECRSAFEAVGLARHAIADWPADPPIPHDLATRVLASAGRRRSRGGRRAAELM